MYICYINITRLITCITTKPSQLDKTLLLVCQEVM